MPRSTMRTEADYSLRCVCLNEDVVTPHSAQSLPSPDELFMMDLGENKLTGFLVSACGSSAADRASLISFAMCVTLEYISVTAASSKLH